LRVIPSVGKSFYLGEKASKTNRVRSKSSQYLLGLSQSLLQLVTVRFNCQSLLVRLPGLSPSPKSLQGRTLTSISLGPLWSEGDASGGVIKGLLVLLEGTRGGLRGGDAAKPKER